MCVGHLKTQNHLGYLLAREGLLYGQSHTLCKHLITGQLVVVHIEDIVNLTARNHQRVSLYQRVDIKKCIELVVLGALVAGYFASCYSAKDIHNNYIIILQ